MLAIRSATILLIAFLGAPRQDGGVREATKAGITRDRIAGHVKKLCLDMKGRETAQEGEELAARYLAACFKTYGLDAAGDNGEHVQMFAVDAGRGKGTGFNVLGLCQGSDPKLKEEIIAVGAHLDAIGGSGADDDASGLAAVLELAHALASPTMKPKRSLLFCGWGSEEYGIKGSRHFVKSPSVPLDRIKLYVNFDMIGRNDGDSKVVWIAGAASGEPALTRLIEGVKAEKGLTVKLEDPMISPPGDATPFYDAGKPFLYFYTFSYGRMHADYHQPSDTHDKLDYTAMETIVRYCFELLVQLADGAGLPKKADGYTFPHPLQEKPKK